MLFWEVIVFTTMGTHRVHHTSIILPLHILSLLFPQPPSPAWSSRLEALHSGRPLHLSAIKTSKVHEWLEEHIAVYAHITYVSDGAAAHFKNKFQIHELKNNRCASAKCLFCATGHRKNDCDGIGGIVKHQATLHKLRNLICHQLCFRYGASSES